MPEIKYAIYPGSVRLYDGSTVSFTASELAALYQVGDEPYLTVATPLAKAELANTPSYFEYIHLKPRADNNYFDQKDSEHDQKDDLIGEDYDGNRLYVHETKQPYNENM